MRLSRISKPFPAAIALAVLAALLVILLPAPTAAGQIATPSVVINEIMQNPAAVNDSNGEWFEVFNAGSSAVDIDGWTIRDDDIDAHVINNGGPLLVPAGGYVVLGNNADFATNGGVNVDYAYGSSWFLSNSADEVILEDTALVEIDRVEYDGGPDFPDPTGASMALIGPVLDNNDGANWCTSSTPFGAGDLGTPGAANDCPPPEIVINEIMNNPQVVADSVGEWFELHNASNAPVDIDGWTIKDDEFDEHVINNGGPLEIPSGGFLVLGNSDDMGINGGTPVDYSYGSNMFLSNGADEVVLVADGKEVDRVEYDDGATFPDPNGATMSLISPSLDNNVGANWCTASTPFGAGDLGTPGAGNDCPSPELPQIVINEIMQNPSAVFDSAGEWFEIFNAGDSTVDIDGWTIRDDDIDTHVINNSGPLEIPSGGFLVLARNADFAANGGVVADYEYSNFILGNGGDEVVLVDGGDNEIDRVEYDGGPNFPDPNGASMSLVDPAVDNNVGVNWCESSTPFGDGDLGTPGAANVCPPPEIVINEIMQNPAAVGDSSGEWVELFNDGGRSVNIDGWTIKDDGSDSHLIDNGGPLVIPVGDYLVLGRNADSAANGGVTVDYQYSDFILSNSDDEVILVDVGGNEIDRVEYDGGPDFPDPTGASMSLSSPELDNNVGANWCEAVTQFGDGDKGTPGGINICEILTIMEIQGAGHLSPYENEIVATNGIVTAVAFDGFFVQDPDGDGDDDTSDGMWVFMGNFCNGCPDAGDEVQLIDRVDEFIPGGPDTGNLSTTDMAFPNIEVLSTGNDLPDPVIIGRSGRIPPTVMVISPDEIDPPINLQDPVDAAANPFNPDEDGIDFFESLEGMLVTVEDAVAVSAVRSFGSFSSELFTLANNGHPDVIDPNNVRTDRGGINLAAGADGYGDTNPERIQIQFDASDLPFATGTLFPGTVPEINLGDRLGDVTGVVGYDFGNFEVRATTELDITPSGLEPETTSLAGTNEALTVASYNVLNLSPLASDDDQRAKLGSQIANNLGGPDVVALQEIQDNNGDISDCEDQNSQEICDELAETGDGVVDATLTLQLLVDAIAAAGGPQYEFFNVNPPEGSSGGIPLGNIRNAFLYNPERVELDGFVSLTETVLSGVGADPDAFFDTRDPLAATFVFEGETFTVINNHLSSRSGSTPIFGGPQPFFQAAETARESQVDALNKYVDFLLGADKNARVIVLGDFNTFEFTNDLTEILPGASDRRAIMKSLLDEIEDHNRYTFIFDGNSQVLDHMFATRSLLEEARFDIVHVNVDFSRLFFDTTASDHEPIIGLFELSSE